MFLHYVLDDWFERVVKKQARGFCELVRYADDFVCLVQYEDDAKRIEAAIERRFAQYGLQLHPEKSGRITFGRFELENALRQIRRPNTFDFLGFTHYCGRNRRGWFTLGRKTSGKKFSATLKVMAGWLRDSRNLFTLKEWWIVLVSKMRGHMQYFGVSGNSRSLSEYRYHVERMVFKWLNRRSQKRSMTWMEFRRYLRHYPLPRAVIVHRFY